MNIGCPIALHSRSELRLKLDNLAMSRNQVNHVTMCGFADDSDVCAKKHYQYMPVSASYNLYGLL